LFIHDNATHREVFPGALPFLGKPLQILSLLCSTFKAHLLIEEKRKRLSAEKKNKLQLYHLGSLRSSYSKPVLLLTSKIVYAF
jgi:hypothetical protein